MKWCMVIVITAVMFCSFPAWAQWTMYNTQQKSTESPWTSERAVEEARAAQVNQGQGTPMNPPGQRIERRTVFREDPRLDMRVQKAQPIDGRMSPEDVDLDSLPVYEEGPK